VAHNKDQKYLNADTALGFVRTNCLFRKGHRDNYTEVDELSNEDIGEWEWTFTQAAKEDLEEYLEEAMSEAKLTLKQTNVINMRIYSERTFEQIAVDLNISRQGAHAHWKRGINNLRIYLIKQQKT
jgi:DNA-directed RNA polymerase sigma subunit (sigma70/sigma32)